MMGLDGHKRYIRDGLKANFATINRIPLLLAFWSNGIE